MSDLANQPETGTGRLELDLGRRLVAEALGTGLLTVAVVGSGIMASRLSPEDVGLQLLENAAATAGALVGLIWMLGAVSGAHFNPAVTLVDRAFGAISTRDAGAYLAAQVAGFLFNSARTGNVTAQIFWLKTRARWRETPTELRHSGVIGHKDMPEYSDEELMRIIREGAEELGLSRLQRE